MEEYNAHDLFRSGVEAAHALIARIQRQRYDDRDLYHAHEALRFVNAITGGQSIPGVGHHTDDDLAALMDTAIIFISAAIKYATAALPEIEQQEAIIAALGYAQRCVTRATESLVAVG